MFYTGISTAQQLMFGVGLTRLGSLDLVSTSFSSPVGSDRNDQLVTSLDGVYCSTVCQGLEYRWVSVLAVGA